MTVDFDDILAENRRRNAELAKFRPQLPLPDGVEPDLERCREDFAYWCANAVSIRDKTTGCMVPFVLNRAQTLVLEKLEEMRKAERPIRLIMLKSRQWGGSTLILYYMAWIQLIHRQNWHAAICSQVKDNSRNIRDMYSRLLSQYPKSLIEPDEDGRVRPYEFKSFEGAQNIRVITGRNCRLSIASAESQESLRGSDLALVHMSEVAFWNDSAAHDPDDFIRAVCSSVTLQPYTMVVLESTANGVGNFFHVEWQRACNGLSDKVPVFIPWCMIDMYSMAVDRPEELWNSLTPYERGLWHTHGCTLEQINWYRQKCRSYTKVESMHAEFPTTADEAFVSSDCNVFPNEHIERLRGDCLPPQKGELDEAGGFVAADNGCLSLWEGPAPGVRYVVSVDVGGRTDKADWSVIAVMTRDKVMPRVVAQWRGHTYRQLLARKAIAIARHYNDALLVIESNSLEGADDAKSPYPVLKYVDENYPYTYRRRSGGASADESRVGFHTNRHTKPLVIDNLMNRVRNHTYIERDVTACDEMATYCQNPSGQYAARKGRHDDVLMTRAIGLYIIETDGANAVLEGDYSSLDYLPEW